MHDHADRDVFALVYTNRLPKREAMSSGAAAKRDGMTTVIID
jgi:hypothetical protein